MDKKQNKAPIKMPIGEILARERTKQKLSKFDIAEKMNLGINFIDAIEANKSIEGVSQTYITGYQRSYTRILGLNESELFVESAAVKRSYESRHENLNLIGSGIKMKNRKSSFKTSYKSLAVLILAGIGVVLLYPTLKALVISDQPSQGINVEFISENESEIIQTVKFKSDKNANSPSDAESKDSGKINIPSELDQSDFSQEVGGDETNIVVTEPAKEEVVIEQKVLPEEAKVTFISNGESWIEIIDANGVRLYRNSLKLDRITIKGTLPLAISTNNLPILRVLSENGEQKKIDIFAEDQKKAKFYLHKDDSGVLQFETM